VQAVYSDVHIGHEPPYETAFGRLGRAYEIGARAESIREALAVDARFSLREPESFGDAPILAVHDPGMLAYLESAWAGWSASGRTEPAVVPDTFVQRGLRDGMGEAPEPRAPIGRIGYWCFDTMTGIVPGTYAATRSAVDVALTATRLVADGERVAYGLCRPPGHHAARAMFGGYCYLNNAAIAAEWLVERTGAPVTILDVDVHHGNGTQQIFWERGDVLYASLHADPAGTFPYFAGAADETGGGRGARATLNLPLAPGTADGAYLETLDRALDRIAGAGDGPVVVSLGLDTYRLDPIGPLALTQAAFAESGRRVAALRRPVVVLQEGGYHVADLGANAVAWLGGLHDGLDDSDR
jgi:acetoin utilization deacetylase AcuC-like enzyme